MERGVIFCRKRGRKMRRERTAFDHVHWLYGGGFRDRSPLRG